MSKTYRHERSEDAELKQLVSRLAQRRAARKLAQLAWGDAAIADLDYDEELVSRVHA